MKLHIILLMLVAVLLVAAPAAAQDTPKPYETMTYDGLERVYHLHVPDSVEDAGSVPLVVVLHSFASSGKALELLSGFDDAADQYGFIVVYPDAVDLFWDDGRVAAGWPPWADPIDDAGFINALVDNLGAQYPVDSEQVHLVGYDNGAVMANRLVCETPERYASITMVSALMRDYTKRLCADTDAPINTFIMLGDADPDFPLTGNQSELVGNNAVFNTFSADDTIDYWLERNGCPTETADTAVKLYTGCDAGTRVIYYAIPGAGGNWLHNSADTTLNRFGVDMTDIIGRYLTGDYSWMATADDVTPLFQIYGFEARSYTLYVPPTYNPDEAAPFVVGLHGRPQTGDGFAYVSDMNYVARENNFIAVYPDGIDMGWDYLSDVPGFDIGRNDPAFLSVMIDDLDLILNLDLDRVYVMGFSNGGFMTQRLACDMKGYNRYAAFGIVGATMTAPLLNLCVASQPVPILLMHGTRDPSVPWNGAQPVSPGRLYSAPDTFGFWAEHNGCDTKNPILEEIPQKGSSPETQVALVHFEGCDGDNEVLFYAIAGGGHNLPGVTDRISAGIAGNINLDIHAGEVIWEFFRDHRLSDREG